jgi:hypothetical protein
MEMGDKRVRCIGIKRVSAQLALNDLVYSGSS